MPDKADLAIGRLGSLFSRLKSRKPIVQAIVAVETGDRSFRWSGADGITAHGNLVAEDTPFFIASIDKLYNAVITMMLSETGKLDLDRPLSTYLPPSMISGLHQYHGVDRTEKITVRHLLTHTSGLADWLEDYPKDGPSLIERILMEGDRVLTIEELAAHVRDHLRPHFPTTGSEGEASKGTLLRHELHVGHSNHRSSDRTAVAPGSSENAI